MSPADIATQSPTKASPEASNVATATVEGESPTTDSKDKASSKGLSADLKRVLKLEVPVTAVLAERDMTIEGILSISVGTIIEFDVAFDSDLNLRVANRPIGSGQAVKIGENFGLRISDIETVRERIDAMGH